MSLYGGIKINVFSSNFLMLSQQREIIDLIARFSMTDCNAVRTPMESNFANEVHTANVQMNNDPDFRPPVFDFSSAIGTLLWIARMTRPDILHAVITLSSYTKHFSAFHVTAVKRVIRYLKGTINYGLRFIRSDDLSTSNLLDIRTLCDADWGGDIETRRSCSGAVTTIFGSFVLATCKKQDIVALSTTEAELIALTEGTKDLKSVYNIIYEMHTAADCPFTWPEQLNVYTDNVAAQFIATQRVHNNRTRHIDIRYMFIRDLIEQMNVRVLRVESSSNTADIFTKALPYVTFIVHRAGLGVTPLPD